MSTVGSDRNSASYSRESGVGSGGPAGAASAREPAPAGPPDSRPRLVRWQGVIPLALFLVVLATGWLLFGHRVVEHTGEEAATKLLGTQVEVASVDIREAESALVIGGLQIADPFDPMRNLAEARHIELELDPVPLLEKKLVVRKLTLDGVRFGTPRSTRAAPAPADGFAATTVGAMKSWAAQFRRPIASFTPIDTIRAIALNPAQLSTVREAQALAGRADSVRGALEAALRRLEVEQTADSARALAERLAAASPRTLGIDGTRRALADVRRTLRAVDSTKRAVESLARDVSGGYATLRTGLDRLDAARREDYAFARSLLRLPTVEGPELSHALFGDVTIERFQQAVYWAELAQQYMPPGLRPRPQDGPERLRAAGTTVRFPKGRDYPSFLLQAGAVDLTIGGDGPAAGRYAATVANVTSEPALVRKPMLVAARRSAEGTGVSSVQLTAVLDHLGARPRDSIGVVAAGIALPAFDLPGLPYRAELGKGTSRLDFVRAGDRVAARWIVRASDVTWRPDSARAGSRSPVEELVSRVVTGLTDLELTADLTGELRSPRLSIRSNLDRALADRLRAVAGEEIARAEARAHAEVDRIVAEKTAPLEAKLADVEAEGARRLADARRQLDAQKAALEGKVRELTRIPGMS